jgi:hypothetical protein
VGKAKGIKMTTLLKNVLENIIDENESLCMDSCDDKRELIDNIVDGLRPTAFSDVIAIAEGIFPTGEIKEATLNRELVIHTGLYNVAHMGDHPVLHHLPEEDTDEWDIAFISESASLDRDR